MAPLGMESYFESTQAHGGEKFLQQKDLGYGRIAFLALLVP